MTANILANSRTPKLQDVRQKQEFHTINKGNNQRAYFQGKNINKFCPNSLIPT